MCDKPSEVATVNSKRMSHTAIDPSVERPGQFADIALPETIPALLERAARLYPQDAALNFFESEVRMTFGALYRTVKRLSHGLHKLGVGHGAHVAVLCSNRLEYPILWLALAELGAVMVPIVLKSTAREILYFLADAQAEFLVVENNLLQDRGLAAGQDGVPPQGRIVTIGGDSDSVTFDTLVAAGDTHFVAPRVPLRSDRINIQYTSGTTGLPKGALLTHRYWILLGVAPVLVWGDWFGDLLAEAPFYYMDAQWMVIASLYTGARVDFAEKMSISKWLDRLYGCRTQVAWFLEQQLKVPPDPRERQCAVKLFMGEHLSRTALIEAQDRFGAPIREAYGSTEAGFVLSVPREISDPSILGTCGIEGPFRKCRVVLPDGRDAPSGTAGELWVTGDGMFEGYYNKPDANAEIFVNEWFRTGDLFVRDAKGFYSFAGRLKDVIRRSGENISAVEVEQVLMSLPEIIQAAVLPVPDPVRGEEVKAYLQLAPGAGRPGNEVILAHCRERLAAFKVPRYVAFVSEFPYTASGKIAKQHLTRDVADLRSGAYDAVDRIQR